MIKEDILLGILDEVEARESELLSWGDTAFFLSEQDLINLIESSTSQVLSDEVLEDLLDRVLLYEILDPNGQVLGYRSRMAESVHLFRNLRQWFPGKQVSEAKSLVSDYRFLRRSRIYPRRDVSPNQLLESLADENNLQASTVQAIRLQTEGFNLSGFQIRATERISASFDMHKRRGKSPSATIVCAGTGSGKTLAFYLPTLSSIATEILNDSTHRVSALAIYPRKELLKDQFNETWLQSRKLDSFLKSHSRRKIRIGALFGDSPHSAYYARKNLTEHQQYIKYDLIRCQTPSCQGEFRWLKEDILTETEILRCNSCSSTIASDEVALTRESICKYPPDIVFTTTEMLNQQMGNPKFYSTFGIHTKNSIPLVLLDEVHTYSGNQGAQTTFLLRRWMRMARTRPHFVGLSATLSDAEDFFSRLTSVDRSRVRLIEPEKTEMAEEGAEYLLALRGDPVSQTALLSTSIQASMLIKRVLDNRDRPVSSGLWGTKTLIFTDKLDVTNRLYWNLADAEGWTHVNGRLQVAPGPSLASLRDPGDTRNLRELRTFGQDWGVAKDIGHSLDEGDRAQISRTSSQDSGFDSDAEIVVATASLEVGFNDPTIGAVIQHKAPQNMSSYLQRKGRAGRNRKMRPWTLVVLSDFGRDRIAYQHYEKLLDPEITLQRLPIDNSHVHRMQSAMAVLDWIGLKIESSMWWALNNPSKVNKNKLAQIESLIDNVLVCEDSRLELEDYLSGSLGLTSDELERILWQPPRSILLEFLPLLKRRIQTQWGKWNFSSDTLHPWAEENNSWRSPVPECIPDNLFSDLNLPTLQIDLMRGSQVAIESMPFFQGLEEFAPGRVSKRYSIRSSYGSDWVMPQSLAIAPSDAPQQIHIDIDEIFPQVSLLDELQEGPKTVCVFQPHRLQTNPLAERNEFGVLSTSNSRLVWNSRFRPSGKPEKHRPPEGSLWKEKLAYVRFHTHRSSNQLEVLRFSTGSNAELRFRNGGLARVKFEWKQGDKDASLGTRMWVDGAEFVFPVGQIDIKEILTDDEILTSLRGAYLQDMLRECSIFDGNQFRADWVWECFIAAIAIEISRRNVSTIVAVNSVLSNNANLSLSSIPSILFQSPMLDMDVLDPEETEQAQNDQKLMEELEDLLSQERVLAELKKLSWVFSDELTSSTEFINWGLRVLANTVAASLCNAMCELLPDVDESSFLAEPILDDEFIRVWIVEQESGGAGVISGLEELYHGDTIAILSSFSRSLRPYEYEILDHDLHYILGMTLDDDEVGNAFKLLRSAQNYESRVQGNIALKTVFSSRGLLWTHSLSSVLHSRVLRPGSNEQSDQRLLRYLDRWKEIEEMSGLELPLNIVALILSDEEENKGNFAGANNISAVLWPRGGVVRRNTLNFYNRFYSENNRTERLLAAKYLAENVVTVPANNTDWLRQVHDELRKQGNVNLSIDISENGRIVKLLTLLQLQPLDAMGLFFYPRVVSVERQESCLVFRIELAEVPQ